MLIGADADAAPFEPHDPHQRSWYDHGARCGSSAADQLKLTDTYRIAAVNDATANTMTITGTDPVLTLRDPHGYGCLEQNCIHAYFGKKGAIDMVEQ